MSSVSRRNAGELSGDAFHVDERKWKLRKSRKPLESLQKKMLTSVKREATETWTRLTQLIAYPFSK